MVQPSTDEDRITKEELRKATRNRGMPLEALALDITPVGLHYLLAHFDFPIIDVNTWSLAVRGDVNHQLDLSIDDLRSMGQVTGAVTMECAGNGRTHMQPRPRGQPWGFEGVSTALWSGVPLRVVLEAAGVHDDSVSVIFTGADRGIRDGRPEQYQFSLDREEALRADVILAYEMNGLPLDPQNGAPLRLVTPGWYGMAHVKWLTAIDVSNEAFHGSQHEAYRYRQSKADPGEPVTKMRVRALMIPPGVPESYSRHRHVEAGDVWLRGRAWSGEAPILRVEVTVNGSWCLAQLDSDSVGPSAWRGWSWPWNAEPGEHLLACRATDEDGNTQPLEPIWNLKGVGNNALQEIAVTVT